MANQNESFILSLTAEEKYECVLISLCGSKAYIEQAKELIGEEQKDRLFILDSILYKTEEAIFRWQRRHGKI
jgi:hypothetical protein